MEYSKPSNFEVYVKEDHSEFSISNLPSEEVILINLLLIYVEMLKPTL